MPQHFALQAERNGVYYLPAEQRSQLEALARASQCEPLNVDLARYSSASGALKKMGDTLHFPAWYGANFDALFDCLTDPDWFGGQGRVILLTGTHRLATTQAEAFATLLDVLQSAAETLRDDSTLFWALIDTPHPALRPLPEA